MTPYLKYALTLKPLVPLYSPTQAGTWGILHRFCFMSNRLTATMVNANIE